MYDANAVLQASVTKVATFNGAGYDLGLSGTPLYTLVARVVYSAATNASGSNSVTFEIQESSDNSTFTQRAVAGADAVVLSTTAQAAEIFIPFRTVLRYVRLTATFTGAGSTPTITYFADLGLTRP